MRSGNSHLADEKDVTHDPALCITSGVSDLLFALSLLLFAVYA